MICACTPRPRACLYIRDRTNEFAPRRAPGVRCDVEDKAAGGSGIRVSLRPKWNFRPDVRAFVCRDLCECSMCTGISIGLFDLDTNYESSVASRYRETRWEGFSLQSLMRNSENFISKIRGNCTK